MNPPDQFQQMQMQQQIMQTGPRPGPPMYAPSHGVYQEAGASAYPNVGYDDSQAHPGNIHYGPVQQQGPVMDQNYAAQGVFPTPPPLQTGPQQEPSPEAYTPDSYQQQDLADLLGTLKVDEKGTGLAPVLDNSTNVHMLTPYSSLFTKQGIFQARGTASH